MRHVASRGGVPGIPDAGWRVVSRAARDATLRSGPVTLHATQRPDLAGGQRPAVYLTGLDPGAH